MKMETNSVHYSHVCHSQILFLFSVVVLLFTFEVNVFVFFFLHVSFTIDKNGWFRLLNQRLLKIAWQVDMNIFIHNRNRKMNEKSSRINKKKIIIIQTREEEEWTKTSNKFYKYRLRFTILHLGLVVWFLIEKDEERIVCGLR